MSEMGRISRNHQDGGWKKGQTGWERQRQRHREGISGVVLGLRLVSVADGYLRFPVDWVMG